MVTLIAVSTAILLGLGAIAVVGFLVWAVKRLVSGKNATADVQAVWVSLPASTIAIGSSGVDFKVHLTAKIGGTTKNLNNIVVAFSATTVNKTVKTPRNGKVKTVDGIAKCNFTGIANGSTKIEAKITIDSKVIKLSAPATGQYETHNY